MRFTLRVMSCNHSLCNTQRGYKYTPLSSMIVRDGDDTDSESNMSLVTHNDFMCHYELQDAKPVQILQTTDSYDLFEFTSEDTSESTSEGASENTSEDTTANINSTDASNIFDGTTDIENPPVTIADVLIMINKHGVVLNRHEKSIHKLINPYESADKSILERYASGNLNQTDTRVMGCFMMIMAVILIFTWIIVITIVALHYRS